MIPTDPTISLVERYTQLKSDRDQYVRRGFEAAELTIPQLMPTESGNPDDSTAEDDQQHDYNTEGAKLVNNLANTYMQTMFPAGRSFVRMGLNEITLSKLEAEGKNRASITSVFSAVERDLRKKFESMGMREALLDYFKHLIVNGNALLYVPKEGLPQTYALDEYVTRSSLGGFNEEIITMDSKTVVNLERDLREKIMEILNCDDTNVHGVKCKLYTQIIRRGSDPNLSLAEQRVNPDNWIVRQSLESIPVMDPYELDVNEQRWFPGVWERTRREQYGRGLVSDHIGSFWVLSILSEALVHGAVTMADVKYLVRPGSVLDIEAINGSESGTYHYGEPDDISTVDKKVERDFRLVVDVITMYKRHLGEVFMHLPSQMRDAERVTAEENHLRAQNLEKSHGGVFSQLAQSLQHPLANLILKEMDVTELEEHDVDLTIVTGFDALARSQENERIRLWVNDMRETQNLPEPVLARMKWSDFMQITAAGRDVDYTNIVMTEEKFQQLQQQQRNAQLQQTGVESALQNATPQEAAAISSQLPQ